MNDTSTEGRILVETGTNGWYEDPENPGKKTRKQNGDQVMTREQYDAMVKEQERKATVKAAAAAAPTQLSSGKLAVGKTTVIRDAWVDPDKRTAKQRKLFESNFEGVAPGKSYEAVVKAANGDEAAMPSGEERTIKVQDAFQVRFSPDNQKKWRNELRRRKTAERRAARKAQKAEA